MFPDTWLVGRQGETPQIVNPADGLTGESWGSGGGDLRDMQMQPGYMTNPAIDRLERARLMSIPQSSVGNPQPMFGLGVEATQCYPQLWISLCKVAAGSWLVPSRGKPASC